MARILGKRRCAWKGLVGGLVGGLAATVAMTQFQNAWSKASEKMSAGNANGNANQHSPNQQGQEHQQEQDQPQEKEDATMKAAGKLAGLTGRELSHDQKKKAGPLVHYGFGTAMGAIYGLTKETAPRGWRQSPPLLSGTAFGTVLFLGADEVGVPALGLSGKPWESPLSSHVYALVSHVVYGAALEGAYALTRKLL